MPRSFMVLGFLSITHPFHRYSNLWIQKRLSLNSGSFCFGYSLGCGHRFFRFVSAAEAQILLQSQPIGTFMFRMDSVDHSLNISVVVEGSRYKNYPLQPAEKQFGLRAVADEQLKEEDILRDRALPKLFERSL